MHIAEEIKDSRRALPKILIYTVLIGFVTMFATALVVSFCMQDLDAIVNSPTGAPVLQVFYQATQNKAGSVFMMTLVLVLITAAVIGSQVTTSRLIWAFARDGALPYSNQ